MKRWTISILMGVAAMLRIRQYSANRSLWLDEAMLSLNILHRTSAQLWQPLDYHQGAPIGFLLAEKWAANLLGGSEFALRLWPLIAGVASIWLFYLLAKRTISGVPLAMALFALSPSLIYYSSEVKQYSSDVAIALLLMWLAVTERIWVLGAVGAAVVWFSHSAVFVLTGIGIVLAYRSWRDIAAFVPAGVSFIACYLVQLRHLSEDSSLLAYWQPYFMSVNPKWFLDRFFDFFASSGALRFLGLAGFVFLCGCVLMWKRDKVTLLLLLSPVLPTLLASAAHKYPFGGRFTLFLVPIVLLLMTEGAEMLRTSTGNQLGVVLLALMLIDPGMYALRKFASPFSPSDRAGVMPLEEMRPVVSQLGKRMQPTDCVYLYHAAHPAFTYYSERSGVSVEPVVSGDTHQFCGTRVWLVLSHLEGTAGDQPEYLKSSFDQSGKRLESISAPGAETELYQMEP